VLWQTQGAIRSATLDWQPWLRFFLRVLDEQVCCLRHTLGHERDVLAALPALSLQIVEWVSAQRASPCQRPSASLAATGIP